MSPHWFIIYLTVSVLAIISFLSSRERCPKMAEAQRRVNKSDFILSDRVKSRINRDLTPHLNKIYKNNATIKKDAISKNFKYATETINALLEVMKEKDKLFKILSPELKPTGSHYERLRVRHASEFDFNVVLKLPFKNEDVKIIAPSSKDAFVKLEVLGDLKKILKTDKRTGAVYNKLCDYFDQDNNLDRCKIHSWIRRLIITAANSHEFQTKKPRDIEKVTASTENGPAFTYILTTTKTVELSVDVVPVINCDNDYPDIIYKSPRFEKLKQNEKVWCLVPKPYSTQEEKDDGKLWRIAFPEAEKALIPGRGCVRRLIKLFKLLKLSRKWNKLASYYIKSFILLELDVDEDKTKWDLDNLGILYLEMLIKLKDVLEKRNLPFYFNRKANLLANIKSTFLKSYVQDIDNIIKKISKSPELILGYYDFETF